MFTNGIRLGHHVYGTDAAFGPAFMSAIDVRTGEIAWRERGFARANLLHAGGKFVILDEDGTLALARMSPSGMTVLARASLFGTTAWTVPTLSGTTLYARDRERMVALDLGASGPLRPGRR
jgi:outer membrane protein assembly factor BamB